MFVLENIMNYENHPETLAMIQKIIPIEKVGGRDQVPANFVQDQLALDPVKIAENILGLTNGGYDKGSDSVIAISMVAMHFKSAVINEISKINFDFNERKSTWDEYLAGVVMLGFEEIARWESDNEDENVKTELMFKHKDHTIIWVLNSFEFSNGESKKVNSSNLYFNLTLKNGVDDNHDIPMSRGYHYGTHIISGSLDMREMPSFRLQQLFTQFDFVDQWIDEGIYSEQLMNKETMSKVDDEILEKIFGKVTRNLKYSGEDLNAVMKTEFFEKSKDFYYGLSKKEQKHIHFYGSLFDGRWGNNPFLSEDLTKKAIESGFTENEIVYLTAQIIDFDINAKFENPWQEQKLIAKVLTMDELKKLMFLVAEEKEVTSYRRFDNLDDKTIKNIMKIVKDN